MTVDFLQLLDGRPRCSICDEELDLGWAEHNGLFFCSVHARFFYRWCALIEIKTRDHTKAFLKRYERITRKKRQLKRWRYKIEQGFEKFHFAYSFTFTYASLGNHVFNCYYVLDYIYPGVDWIFSVNDPEWFTAKYIISAIGNFMYFSSSDISRTINKVNNYLRRKNREKLNFIWLLDFGSINERPHFHMACDQFLEIDMVRDKWRAKQSEGGYILGNVNVTYADFDYYAKKHLRVKKFDREVFGMKRFSASQSIPSILSNADIKQRSSWYWDKEILDLREIILQCYNKKMSE